MYNFDGIKFVVMLLIFLIFSFIDCTERAFSQLLNDCEMLELRVFN